MVPTVYLFDTRGQRLCCGLVVLGNVLFTFVYVTFFFPDVKIVSMPAEDLKGTLMSNAVGMSIYAAVMIGFFGLSGQVYEDAKRTSEATEAAAKEKEAFFAAISHEIRNPLQSLLVSVELLADPESHREKARLIEICKSCCALIINMVSNILDMSKIAAAKMQLSPVPADLSEIMGRIVRMSRGRAEGKRVRLELDCAHNFPPAVEVDTQRFEQIVMNLVSNAVKFTGPGGIVGCKLSWLPCESEEQVAGIVKEALSRSDWKQAMEFGEIDAISLRSHHGLGNKYTGSPMPSLRAMSARDKEKIRSESPPKIRARPPEEMGVVKLEVMDTGIGILKDSIDKLFRPYQQANSSISRLFAYLVIVRRKYGGTGLGLWITKNILMQMKGDIRVKSKPGKGTNFIIAFPALVSKEVAPLVSASGGKDTKDPTLLSGKKYLILDDVPENTFILGEALRRCGAEVVTAQSGTAALELFRNRGTDFAGIITDLRMPMMSGQTFITEVRKCERELFHGSAPVRILVVSAESSAEERRQCLSHYGADEFLLKPVKLQELVAALARTHNKDKPVAISKRALIVEDDVIGSQFLFTMLTRAGHKCKQAFSVKEALDMIKPGEAEGWDIILLDNFLGDGTGAEFLMKATQNAEVGRLHAKVVSMSGNSVEEQRENYAGYRVDSFLQKPVRKQDLLDIFRAE